MQPQSPHPSLQVQPEHVTDEKASELRRHAGARDVGYGWLRIARSESFHGRVLLVSKSAPLSVSFPYGSANLDQVRASLSASIYASRNRHPVRSDILEVAKRDAPPSISAS